jgi:predicted nucleotidyltransferase
MRRVIDDAVIEDAGRRLAAAARSPARVVLFGSRARGGARDDSDLDFLVIEEQVESKLDEMVRLRDALPPLGVPVDVVVISEEEAARRERVPSTLIHRALREGRVLVAA